MGGLFSFTMRRLRVNLRDEVLVLPSRTLALVWVVGVLALPLLSSDTYILRIAAYTCLYAILAASWDLLAGYAGQVNFGQALFFGTGAYASGLLVSKLGLPPWFAVCVAALAGALAGFATGVLCLRLRGSYLSLATLALPLIATGLLFAFPRFSGGELGISGLPRVTGSSAGDYYVAAVAMLIAVFGLWQFANSRFGLVLHAIRDDEVAARASGINTPRYKLAAFAISGLAAGLAGALFAHVVRVAGPSTLEVALSFQVVIWGVFGGLASIYGPVAAVFILFPLTEWLGSMGRIGELRLLIFAVIVLVVLLLVPRGLAPWTRDKIEPQCPRCKQRNGAWRSACRLCSAPMKLLPAAAGYRPR